MGQKHRSRKSDESRRQLLDAALRVIAQKGYSAATIDEIVREAGVSKGLAYYHFKSKAAMASSILDQGVGELSRQFEAIAQSAPNATEALARIFGVFTGAIVNNREFGRFFVSELWREGRVWSEELRADEERMVHVIASQLQRGQHEGSIRPEIDPTFDAVAIIGLVLTTSLYYLSDSGERCSADEDAYVCKIRDFVSHATISAS